MASKFIALFALVAVAHAQYHNDYHYQSDYDHHYAAPAVIKQIQPAVIKQIQPAIIKQVQPALIKKVEYQEAPANYEFNYDVHDHHTGDIKQQHEVAKDGAVQGEYSLIDADGYRRIVSYTADDHHGFVAQVRREPVEGHKIIAQPTITKVIQPATITKVVQPAIAKVISPVQHYNAQPIQYHQPAVHYQQPAVHYQQPAVHYQQPAVHYQQPAIHYQQPAQVKVAVPVQKYIAPAPVVQKYVQSAPIVKSIAQPVVKYTSAEHSAHVSVNAPHVNYHY